MCYYHSYCPYIKSTWGGSLQGNGLRSEGFLVQGPYAAGRSSSSVPRDPAREVVVRKRKRKPLLTVNYSKYKVSCGSSDNNLANQAGNKQTYIFYIAILINYSPIRPPLFSLVCECGHSGGGHASLLAAVCTSVFSTSDTQQPFMCYYSACVFGPVETCVLALLPLWGIDLARLHG